MDENGFVTQKRIRKHFDVSTRAKSFYTQGRSADHSSSGSIPLSQTTISYRDGGIEDETDPYLMLNKLRRDRWYNPLDTGHEFYTRKTEIDMAQPAVHYRSRDQLEYPAMRNVLDGPIYLGDWRNDLSGDIAFDSYRDECAYRGRQWINDTAPTQPHASLAQFIGELKEGLPSLLGYDWKTGKGWRPDRDGGYLNLSFGTLPLLKDLSKLFNAVVNSKQLVEQYVRDAEPGKAVRRKRSADPIVTVTSNEERYYELPNGVPNTSLYWGSVWAYTGGDSYMPRPVRRFETQTDTYWFSASYRYSVPDGDEILERFARYESLANKILGSRFNIGTIYELTPWSWLADWQSDLGTLLDNANLFSNGDQLALRYGYVMHKLVREVGYSYSNYRLDDKTTLDSIDTLYRTTWKQRYRASPFGFGVNGNQQMSQRQLDTLTAIVSNGGRSPRK